MQPKRLRATVSLVLGEPLQSMNHKESLCSDIIQGLFSSIILFVSFCRRFLGVDQMVQVGNIT